MKLNFLEIVKKKNLNSIDDIKQYLIGKTATVLDKEHGHNYGEIGETFKIIKETDFNTGSLSRGIIGGNNIKYTQFSVDITENKEYIVDSIEKLENKKSLIDDELKKEHAKLAFLIESELDELDEVSFKIAASLNIIESKSMSKAKKIKLIKDLINI
tara:strand:- start:52436 stop:52906 length:471 start_codon:yes stop_codon:yes gene_type:complete